MDESPATGYAPVNGVEMYWESYGDEAGGGTPVVVVHGGFGLAAMFGGLLRELSRERRVVAVDLQGHGHTRDIDRPFTYEAFGDDVASLIEHLALGSADLVGYSLGGGACLRTAIDHPQLVRKLAVVSAPFRREGWFAEVRGGMDQMGRGLFDQLTQSPMYAAYAAVAPDAAAFPTLMDKTGELLRQDYDWTDGVKGLTVEAMLVFGDADSMPISHMAEFFALLGGGLRDGGWDGSTRPLAKLAILPGRTHYDIFDSLQLLAVVDEFLG